MRAPISTQLLRVAALLLVVGLLTFLAAFFAYFLVFASSSDFSLSRSDTNWSNFGSYLGGVLGPAFSFLAFIAVLFTVWLQAHQIDTAKHQAHLEEIQRVIFSVSQHIDSVLAQEAGPTAQSVSLQTSERTVFTVLAAGGTAALLSKPQARESTIIEIAKEALLLQANALIIELQQLVWCLNEYKSEGGE